MQARSKPLDIIEPESNENLVESKIFEKPDTKNACKLIDANNVSELISLLQNEAKVI